jgi:hypothetical protein
MSSRSLAQYGFLSIKALTCALLSSRISRSPPLVSSASSSSVRSEGFLLNSMWLIARPAFLLLLFDCFGKSVFLQTGLITLLRITEVSAMNLFQSRAGRVNILLLECLGSDSERMTISNCGRDVTLAMWATDREEIALPFLAAIASQASSYSIAARFADHTALLSWSRAKSRRSWQI